MPVEAGYRLKVLPDLHLVPFYKPFMEFKQNRVRIVSLFKKKKDQLDLTNNPCLIKEIFE